jgi:hypothetical protein
MPSNWAMRCYAFQLTVPWDVIKEVVITQAAKKF